MDPGRGPARAPLAMTNDIPKFTGGPEDGSSSVERPSSQHVWASEPTVPAKPCFAANRIAAVFRSGRMHLELNVSIASTKGRTSRRSSRRQLPRRAHQMDARC